MNNNQQQIDVNQVTNNIIASITKQLGTLGNIIEQLSNEIVAMQQYIQSNQKPELKEYNSQGTEK